MEFAQLFAGNPDAYGADTSHGVRCVRQPLWQGIGEHLEHGQSCGVYPTYEGRVKWGCSDIDNGSLADAVQLFRVLERMNLDPWLEISKSKGYHVWVFAQSWVPAWVMRRAFLFAHYVTDQIGHPVPPTEVNPKAEWLEEGQLGNFVRLPYVGRKPDENGRRTMITLDGDPINFNTFTKSVIGANEAELRYWADKYQPPRRSFGQWGESSAEAKDLAARLTGLGFIIWRDGPLPGGKRSNTMAHLAIECRKSGLTEAEALVIISDLDDRLEKWTDRSAEGTAKARRSCVEWGYANA